MKIFNNHLPTNPLILTILFSICFSWAALSQNFVQLENVEMRGGYLGAMSWCDYNSDGFPDLLVSGSDYGTPLSYATFYLNNGDNSFTLANISIVPKVIYGSMAWGDMNNNGTPDLVLAGTTSGFCADNYTGIYKNNGDGSFEEVLHDLPNLSQCFFEWIDIDNDGWNDIYYQGINADNEFDLGVFKNLHNNQFELAGIDIEKISGPRGNFTANRAVWADFDNDGLKDVAISMSSQLEFDYVFYKNLGTFNFEFIDIGLPHLNYVHQKAGDFNQDGLMDLVFTGSDKLDLSSVDWHADLHFYFNHGDLQFSEDYKIDNIGIFWTTLDIGDYSNDGFLDVMVYGTASDFSTIRFFVNNQDNTFSDLEHNVIGAEDGSSWFADFDNDNDLDLALTGRFNSSNDYEATFVYENQENLTNQPPQPPDTLRIFAVNDDLTISWNEGTDDLTAPVSLFYNLQIGTDEFPNSLISSCSMDGKLKINNTGNLNLNNSFLYKDFPEGSFQAGVQSIDHAFNASNFSIPLEFCFKHSRHLFSDTITGCYGDSVLLQVEGSYLSYLWNTGSTDSVVFVKDNKFFNVNLTHTDGCISSETTYVKFYDKPLLNLGMDTTISIYDTLVIYPESLYNSIVWNDGSTADSLIVIGNNYTPETYDFWAQVTNAYGCMVSDTISVTMVDNSSIKEKEAQLNFSLFPNPASEYVRIVSKGEYSGTASIELLDFTGKAIFAKKGILNDELINIDISNEKPGIYLVKFNLGNSYSVKKLIIK